MNKSEFERNWFTDERWDRNWHSEWIFAACGFKLAGKCEPNGMEVGKCEIIQLQSKISLAMFQTNEGSAIQITQRNTVVYDVFSSLF